PNTRRRPGSRWRRDTGRRRTPPGGIVGMERAAGACAKGSRSDGCTTLAEPLQRSARLPPVLSVFILVAHNRSPRPADLQTMRLFAALIALTVASDAIAADNARTRMEAFSKGLNSVSGSFAQSVTDANGHRGDESRGTLALEAPRQFRWETLAP